ncbi:MAG: enoyl-CoA hydratase/isomerase family protein [Burkholderiales bacterium]|nr:enoyl-CoA hydratase/isomerase family protein [Burkholderiales bacterium]
MTEPVVRYESRDGIAVITLNRPEKRNAINNDVALGLRDAWLRLNESNDRVGVITHAGAHFTGGADIKGPPEDFPGSVPNVGVVLQKPLIAAVGGWVVGGGVVIVQMCDLCVAADDAKFMFPEAKVGFTGALIAGLAARIPHKVAMELMLLGDEISAARMHEVGLVNRLVPPGRQLDAALEYARRLADNAPLVLSVLREFVGQVIPKGPSELTAHGRLALARVRQSEDAKEGIASFREKRRARFKGK